MNIFRRQRRSDVVNEDYWRSFVDIMTTISVVFVLLVTIVIVMTVSQTHKANSLNAINITQAAKDAQRNEDTEKVIQQINSIAQQKDTILNEIKDSLPESLKKDARIENHILIINTKTQFDTDKWILSEEGKIQAQQIGEAFAKIIEKNKRDHGNDQIQIQYIEVTGHASNPGDKVINRTLSVMRAGVYVEKMLANINRNVYGPYFRSSGMSYFEPIEGTIEVTQDDIQKLANQRVEFKVIFNDERINQFIMTQLDELKKKYE